MNELNVSNTQFSKDAQQGIYPPSCSFEQNLSFRILRILGHYLFVWNYEKKLFFYFYKVSLFKSYGIQNLKNVLFSHLRQKILKKWL